MNEPVRMPGNPMDLRFGALSAPASAHVPEEPPTPPPPEMPEPSVPSPQAPPPEDPIPVRDPPAMPPPVAEG